MPISIAPPLPEEPPVIGPPPSLRERWIWVSPSGVEFELTNFANGVEVVKGMSGRGAPPVRTTRDRVPGKAGERTRNVSHGLREVSMPLFVNGNNFDGLNQLLETLVEYMDPVAGIGTLRRIHRDGTTNDLFCRVVGGLSINGEGSSGPSFHRPILIFQADDPYWYGPVQSRQFSGSEPQSWFPWLPISLGKSSVIGQTTVINDSLIETYPVWSIVGPGSGVEITNTTTNKTFALEFPTPLTTGQTVIVDTRDYVKTVTGPTGANWRRYLSQRGLWALAPGPNAVVLAMSGTDDDSYIAMNYRVRKLYAR